MYQTAIAIQVFEIVSMFAWIIDIKHNMKIPMPKIAPGIPSEKENFRGIPV